MANVLIRSAVADEISSAVSVWSESWRAESSSAPDAAREQALRATAGLPDAHLLVATRDGDTIGMGLLVHAREEPAGTPILPHVGHISYLYVLPSVWRQGTGRAILLELIDEARNRDYRQLQLDVHATNDAAQALYRAAGFTPTGLSRTNDRGDLIIRLRLHLCHSLTVPGDPAGD